jgi:hypothetical protein
MSLGAPQVAAAPEGDLKASVEHRPPFSAKFLRVSRSAISACPYRRMITISYLREN